MADATNAWNQSCANWQFPSAPLGNNRSTFTDAWNSQAPHVGLTIGAALSGITTDVNHALGTSQTPPDDGDLFDSTIQNWGP
jgi:hypothetical protein